MTRRILVNLALTLFALTVVVPLVWVFISSFKTGNEIFDSPWGLPSKLRFENYSNAWHQANIGKYFVNSLIVTLSTLVILIPISSMAAYVLARYKFKGANLILGGFLGGMMFPHFLIIVPLFFLLANLGVLDTRTGLVIVYVAYSLSFTVFVLNGFFQVLPDELAEAAMIDGCGHVGTFWKVMMPLAKPGLIVVGIFNAIGLWNEYGLALVLVQSADQQTLPVGFAKLTMVQHYQSDWGALFAGLVIVMMPVLLVYWIFRDRIYEAMLAGALKG